MANDKKASKSLQNYIAMRIANVSSAVWKETPKDRRAEFVRAARRAIVGFNRHDGVLAKRKERKEQKSKAVTTKVGEN